MEILSSLLLELENDRCSLVAPISILRFNLERGEFPLLVISFESGSALDRWTKYVIRYFGNVLEEAQVLSVIHSSTNLSITRDSQLVCCFRGGVLSHTFVATWVDFGPTVEDVDVLLRLNLLVV